MVVCHRTRGDRLASRFDCRCHTLFDEDELVLRLQRQGSSIILVTLPPLLLPRHGDHVIVGLFSIGVGLLQVATQRVDARAQRDIKSGPSDTLAGVAPFEIAPSFLCGEYLIPTI